MLQLVDKRIRASSFAGYLTLILQIEAVRVSS